MAWRSAENVRQRGQEPYIYLLLLTTKGRKENIIEGLDAGADDYLTKPFDPQELQVRLRTGMRIVKLQAEIIEAREALRVQATHDALTGVWNRRAILEMLGTELVRSSRDDLPVAVAMADLDHFKRINDTYGHIAGDAVLREAVSRMRALLRPYDAMGRYGGEEFLVVLPGCTAQDAFRLAERLRIGISQEPMVIPGGTIEVTSSLGVAANDMTAALDATALIQAADTALYRAKAGGRNRVEVATATDLTSHTASSNIAAVYVNGGAMLEEGIVGFLAGAQLPGQGGRAVKILIAEDDMVSRRLLEATLIKWGYEVVVTCDGTAAWEVLQRADAPPLAILDWMMPGMDGIEVCRQGSTRRLCPRHPISFFSRQRDAGRISLPVCARARTTMSRSLLTAKSCGRVSKWACVSWSCNRAWRTASKPSKRPWHGCKQLQGLLPDMFILQKNP